MAVQPHDRVAVGRAELVHEEARAAEQHVLHAFDPFEAVVEVVRRRDELMLAHVQALALAEVQGHALARRVPREGDPPRAQRLGDEELEPGDLALDRARKFLQLHVHLRFLPQQHVVLEHHAHVPEVDLQLGHEFAADVIGHARERLVVDDRGIGSGRCMAECSALPALSLLAAAHRGPAVDAARRASAEHLGDARRVIGQQLRHAHRPQVFLP